MLNSIRYCRTQGDRHGKDISDRVRGARGYRVSFVQAILHAGKALISTVSVVEARMVVHGRRGQRAVVLVDDFLPLPVLELVAPRVAEIDPAC